MVVTWKKSSSATRPQWPGRSWARKFYIFVGCAVVSTIILGSHFNVLPGFSHATSAMDSILIHLGLQKTVFAVIIDAGCTSSRVQAFSFHESLIDKDLTLDKEMFVQIKPGLSSFADNPEKGAKNLQELLDHAMQFVPQSEWTHTPLVMKATAGLRLLPKAKAEALLREVRKRFDTSPFLRNANSVSIMDGVDEGVLLWFTVNFLRDRLGGDVEDTVAALDLGGGSTQITFAISDEANLKKIKPEFLHRISVSQQNLTVYAHSYLGLGLMAARKEILSVGNPKKSKTLKSECINPNISTKWEYGGVTYKIKGSQNPTSKVISGIANKSVGENQPIVQFKKCLKLVKNCVSHKVDKPVDLLRKEINAFSYYFDRAIAYGLIDQFAGGVVTVKQFYDAALSSCGTSNADQPFMCIDLTFISVLLQDGFGLEPSSTLHLYKKIDNHRISWALGAAFHILQNGL